MRIDLDAGHDFLVTLSTARVPVNLIDELGDRMNAVADDMGGYTLGDRDQLAIDNQDAMIAPFEELLDDHPPAMFTGKVEAKAELFLVRDPRGDSSPVIPVQRLGDEREAQASCLA
jgi:hypothetical protein